MDTGGAVDLAASDPHTLELYSNGAHDCQCNQCRSQEQLRMVNVFVLANPGANSAILAVADVTNKFSNQFQW